MSDVADLERRLRIVEQKLQAMGVAAAGGSSTRASAAAPTSSSASGRPVATDRDLDGQYGSPEVKKDPPRWNGPSYAGRTMSDCPSDYLNALAEFYEWRGDADERDGKTYVHKASGENRPTAPLRRKDAALARGWSIRNQGKTFDAPEPSDANEEELF